MIFVGIIIAAVICYVIIMWLANGAINLAVDIPDIQNKLSASMSGNNSVPTKILAGLGYIAISLVYFLGMAIVAIYVGSLIHGKNNDE